MINIQNNEKTAVNMDSEITSPVAVDNMHCNLVNADMNNRDDKGETSTPYFPQPGDNLPAKVEDTMKPIGPWATGRVSYTPAAGITGVRPVADRYSITRFGPSDWKSHNYTFFQESNEKIYDAQLTRSTAKQCIEQIYKKADKDQLEITNLLKIRANEVYRWKLEIERTLERLAEEIGFQENERRRVKQSLSVITIPESIAGECLELRRNRLESDLVKDDVENELIKEVALCAEIRDVLVKTREKIDHQLIELRAAKARLENDWTDKTDAYKIDSICVKMTNESPVLMWKPGAARFPAEQSTPASYENFTQEIVTAGETVRQKSVTLRSTLDDIYINLIKDLKEQAARVDAVLSDKINLTVGICQQLEKELQRCLCELANTERLIEELKVSTKGLNNAIKLAQTRLSNRLLRHNIESCRDVPQFALVDEVKTLGERVSVMLAELKKAESTQAGLVKVRGDLEREIIIKRKSLYIDQERGRLLRSFYPSGVALSGF